MSWWTMSGLPSSHDNNGASQPTSPMALQAAMTGALLAP